MGCRVQGRKREKRASLAQGSLRYIRPEKPSLAQGSLGYSVEGPVRREGRKASLAQGSLGYSVARGSGTTSPTSLQASGGAVSAGSGTLSANSHVADSDFQSRFLTPYSFAAAKYGSDTNTIPPIIFPRVTRRRL